VWEASGPPVRILLAAATTLLYLTGRAPALTVRALALDDLVARADRIVLAQCVRVAPLTPAGTVPVVEMTLAVEETLKGEAGERLTIRQLANVLPTCRPGDEVVLFLHAPSGAGLTSPVGADQGYLRVVRVPGEAARIVGDARIVGALGRTAAPASSVASQTASGRPGFAPLEPALEEIRARVRRLR
jgi:hypothetical protein